MQLLDIEDIPVDRVRQPLSSESKLRDLILYQCEVDISQLGLTLSKIFEENLVLPGVIVRRDEKFLGMLSRRRFLEIMSRRYGPELFMKRPIQLLFEYARPDVLVLPAETKIIDAIQPALGRAPELLYEPIVVRFEPGTERLLDLHHLLLAHTRIHELTMRQLNEQTESKLLQTEKMASLGEMVAGVAHEILNPVNFICGNLEYLSNYGEDLITILNAYETEFPEASPAIAALKDELEFEFLVEDFPKTISSMQIGSNRLRKIISALRSFSHIDEAIKRPIDIHECLDNTVLILNSRIKNFIEIEKNYTTLPEVSCFSGQLSQVFTNLIANAIDALGERSEDNSDPTWKPKITITTTLLPQSAASKRDQVSIAIQDNGPGIPPEIQTKIFEIFFTTKPVGKGTGFGLAIARQIIMEKHNGDLLLDSTPGIGTTFTIILPIN